MAADRIGVPVSDVIFVDDNINAVKTAKEAGMRAFGIFDESSREQREEIRAISEKYLEKFSELLLEENR